MSRRFAVFDIDGTIFRWQLYHELFDAFVENNIINQEDSLPALDAREAWRKRAASYLAYEDVLVKVMEKSIVGLQVDTFNSIADQILSRKGHHVYHYTLSLLKDLKSKDYATIAISGSHQQLVERFCQLHSIEFAVGRNYKIKNNTVSDQVDSVLGRKGAILKQLVQEHDLSWEGSYAVGDSNGDTGMLELVENPVAFNPSEELLSTAQSKGWPIVIERKNIAYRLEKGQDGTYLLAQADSY